MNSRAKRVRVGGPLGPYAFEHGSYSVPDTPAGQTVRVRPYRDQVVITHVGDAGPVEVARHDRTTLGSPRVDDAHFPPRPEGQLERTPRPRTDAETQFLALGDGAALWLTEDPGEDGRGGRPGRVARPGSGGSGARAGRGHRPVRGTATWPRS